MRLLKPFLLCLVLACLGTVWRHREVVTDAYLNPDEPVEVHFTGVNLAVALTPIEPSPFKVSEAPDTGSVPIALAYRRPEVDEPSPPVAMSGGEATLSGTVLFPSSAPVASSTGSSYPANPSTPSSTRPSVRVGGVVRLERHTADGIGVLDVPFGADGRWSHSGLPGGRYRVRAWSPGRYTTASVAVFYLEADTAKTVDFALRGVSPSWNVRLTSGGTIYEGLRGSVALTVSRQIVDQSGILRTVPVSGVQFSIGGTGIYDRLGNTPLITDRQGSVLVSLRCRQPGAAILWATYHDGTNQPRRVSFALPSCAPSPTGPVPGPDQPTTTSPSTTSTTSTTVATTVTTATDGEGQEGQ